AAEEPTRPAPGDQAQDLRGSRPSAPGAEAGAAPREQVRKPMSPERVTVIWSTGKRKSSVARVRLQPGAGEIVVNTRPLDAYFGRETSRMIVHQPFEVTSTAGQYRTDVSVQGGGVSAQAVAIRHGITRALLQRLLARHPAVELAFLSSEQYRDRRAADIYPFLAGIVETALRAPEPAEVAAAAEIVFTALPHAAAAPVVAELVRRGRRVI